MKWRALAVSSFALWMSVGACDCGATAPAGSDAGPIITYDAGNSDALIADHVAADTTGSDLEAQDALAVDSAEQDAARQDVAEQDAALEDAAETDAFAEDASADADGAIDDAAVAIDASSGADATNTIDGSSDDGATASDAASDIDAAASSDAATDPDAAMGSDAFVIINHDPTLSDASNSPEPWTGSTTVSATASDVDSSDTVSCSFSEISNTGVSFGSVSDCSVVVSEPAGGLAKDSQVIIRISASDGQGGSVTSDIVTTIGNHDPSANAGADRSLLPGDPAVSLSGVASDLDGNLGVSPCTWSVSGGLPGGVSIGNQNACTTSLDVNRAQYVGDPEGATISLTLIVIDQDGASHQDSMQVNILDERGPYVSNLSSWEGVGYGETGARHGFCGAASHPCKFIDDAKQNLAANLNNQDSGYPASIIVATTGTGYQRASEILLDNDLSLECGFSALTWARDNAYTQTPILFSSATGVHATTNVTIRGCDLQGIASDSGPFAFRQGVYADQAVIQLLDSRVRANTGNASDADTAIGVLLENPSASARPVVDNCHVEATLATSTAFGLYSEDGVPQLTQSTISGGSADNVAGVSLGTAVAGAGMERALVQGCTIRGGVSQGAANNAIGLRVIAGDPLVQSNTSITGGDGEGSLVGILIEGAGGLGVAINNNGLIQGTDLISGARFAEGLMASAPLSSTGNTYQGGFAKIAIGAVITGDDVSASFSEDSLRGGDGIDDPRIANDAIAVGLYATADSTSNHVTAMSCRILGQYLTGSSRAQTEMAVGVYQETGAILDINDSSIDSGSAKASTFGWNSELNAGSATLNNVVIATNSPSNSSGTSSHGISHKGGILSITGGSITVADAGTWSTALFNAWDAAQSAGAGNTTISNCALRGGDVSDPGADAYGIWHQSGILSVEGGSILSGAGPAYSDGINFDCQGPVGLASHRLSKVSISTGEAKGTSGIYGQNCGAISTDSTQISSGAATGGSAYGIILYGTKLTMTDDTVTTGSSERNSQAVRVQNATLTATNLSATGADVDASGGTARSIGIHLANADNTIITGGTIRSGKASGSTDSDSAAVRLSTATSDRVTIKGATLIAGDTDGESYGLVNTFPVNAIILDENKISAGDGWRSAGMRFKSSVGYLTGATPDLSVISDNDIRAGIGTDATVGSSGVWFDADCNGCRIDRNFIDGGDQSNVGGRSVGLHSYSRATWTSNLDEMTYITNNVIRAGMGLDTRGVEADGNGANNMRFLHNNIHGGGMHGGRSYGVFMGTFSVGNGDLVGVFSGNIVDPGDGDASFGYFENCDNSSGPTLRSQPVRAANTAFWPLAASAFVHRAGNNCVVTDLSTIGDVNSSSPYNGASISISYSVDPVFLADGYHLDAASPLKEKAVETSHWWNTGALGSMGDIDQGSRPLGIFADIGVDEAP